MGCGNMQNVEFKLMMGLVNIDRNVELSSYISISFDSNSRNVALTLGVRYSSSRRTQD